MRNKLLRFTALFVFAVICAGILCGCKENNSPSEVETDPPDTDAVSTQDYTVIKNDYYTSAAEKVSSLPAGDFGGAEFIIATSVPSLFSVDDSMSKNVSDAVVQRNALIEDKYNVSLKIKFSDSGSMFTEVKQSVLAGEHYADIITPSEESLGSYIIGGLLTNLAADGSSWNDSYLGQSAVKASSGGNSVYAVGGDLTLKPESAVVLYFNKDIMNQLGLESPYTLVETGQWTWDKYYEYTAELAALNAAGAESGAQKIYSYSVQSLWEYICDIGFISSGGTYVNSGYGAVPSLWITSDNTEPIIEKIKPFVDDTQANGNRLSSTVDFMEGKSLFHIDTLELADSFSEGAVSWGILPFPKYSADQQGYHTLLFPETAYVAASPVFDERAPMVRTVMRGLCAASEDYIRDAYITQYMNYTLRDYKSVDMLDIILSGGKYDMAYVVGGNNMYISSTTYYGVRSALDRTYSVQRFLDMWTTGTNNAFAKYFPMPETVPAG